MKCLKLILILILLGACSTEDKKETNNLTLNKKPSSKEDAYETKNLPKSFNSEKLVVPVEEVEEFYNTDLGHFSYYIPRKDKGDYKVTWNLLDGSEVYYCFVESDKYQKSTRCKCYKSEAFDRWLNGEELIEYQEETIEYQDEAINKDANIDKKESTQEKYSNMYEEMCNNSNVSDYIDLYDEYEQEFEDEDDAFDFYYTYCE